MVRDYTLLAPRYWPLWLLLGCLRVLIFLPYPLLLRLGSGLGAVLVRLPSKMRRTTAINLALCFPELSATARARLLRENFASIGIGVVETALGWWASDARLRPLAHFSGFEQVASARARGKGVLLCGAHFSCLEIAGRLAAQHMPLAVVYRPQKNRLLEKINRAASQRHYAVVLRRDDPRGLLRCLKNNLCVWYTPDVDAGLKNSLFAPFFGVMAASVTATPRLLKLSDAVFLPAAFYRRTDKRGYDLELGPVPKNLPTPDLAADVRQINQLLETAIRRQPAQYIWQYKRFKTRPPGEARFY